MYLALVGTYEHVRVHLSTTCTPPSPRRRLWRRSLFQRLRLRDRHLRGPASRRHLLRTTASAPQTTAASALLTPTHSTRRL